MRRNATILALMLTICVLTSSLGVAQAQQPNPTFILALAAIEARDYSGARDLLREVVGAEPNNETAWYYLGVAECETDNLAEALEAFIQAQKLAPRRKGIRLYIGHIYEVQGALTEAMGMYQQEVYQTRGGPRAEALMALGRVYVATGRLHEAINVLQEATDIEPNYLEALYYLGIVQTRLKQYAEAVATFEKARKILEEWDDFRTRLQRLSKPEQRMYRQTEEDMAQQYGRVVHFAEELGMWPDLNKARGDAHLAAGEWAAARNAYRAALKRKQLGSESDPDVYTRVARAYLADAREIFEDDGLLFGCIKILGSAERSIAKALEFDANYAPAHEALGEIYAFEAATYVSQPDRDIVSHTCKEAIEEFRKALHIHDKYQRARLYLARTYTDHAAMLPAGQADALEALQQARGLIQEALGVDPVNVELYAELARVELAQENWPGALQTAQHALSIDGNNITALNVAGMACYYQNELGKAVEYFSRAIKVEPRAAQAYTNLANAFFQMQSWYRARREYKKALAHTPEALAANTVYQRSYILYLMGLTHHETHTYDEEIEVLNDALALDPTYTAAHRQLGRAHLAKEEYRAARRALEIAAQQASTDEEQADIQAQIGQVYEAESDAHSAVAAYGAALQLDPNNRNAAAAIRRLSQF